MRERINVGTEVGVYTRGDWGLEKDINARIAKIVDEHNRIGMVVDVEITNIHTAEVSHDGIYETNIIISFHIIEEV